MLRPATLNDLDALVHIENNSFEVERISRRSFRHLLTRGHAVTLLDEENSIVRGYVLILFNAGTSLARIYSIAVDSRFRGAHLGRTLVQAAETIACERECAFMRLEIRKDNQASIAMFESLGYRQFGMIADYYEDHQDALRFEKVLAQHNLSQKQLEAPFYRQTLDFTCGPAALMMAMRALDPTVRYSRRLEIRLWREATTVFMMSGHGGCGPYGLALSAFKRGFGVELHVTETGAMFVDSVRNEEKKEVIRLVQEDFLHEIRKRPIELTYGTLGVREMEDKFDAGGVLVVLVSSYRIYREKFPHWVVITGFDDHYIYVNDPLVAHEKSDVDCINMPIPRRDFERMARFGKSGQRAVLVLTKPTTPTTQSYPAHPEPVEG